MEAFSYERRLKKLDIFSLAKWRLGEDTVTPYRYIHGVNVKKKKEGTFLGSKTNTGLCQYRSNGYNVTTGKFRWIT